MIERIEAGLIVPFARWFEWLEFYAAKLNFPVADQESYRDYYDDGHTPTEALQEEMDCASA